MSRARLAASLSAACLLAALPLAALPLAVLPLAVLPLAARADTAPPLTTEQSASLGRALRLWSLGLVADDSGFTATPAEGGYDVAVPVAGPIGSGGARLDGAPVTTHASLGDDGRWHFEAIALPSPLTVHIPGKDGEDLTVVQTWATQTGGATVDPTLAGRSSGETLRTGSRLTLDGGKTPLIVTIARAASHIEWVPATPGRVDAGAITRLDDIAARQGGPAGGPATGPGSADGVKIRTMTLTVESSDTDPDRSSQLVRQGLAFVSGLKLGEHDELTPGQRTELHALVAQLRDLAHGGKHGIVAEGISVTSGHTRVGLDSVSLAHAIQQTDGKLDQHLRLELAGLSLPFLPPGALRDVVPKHFVLATFVRGTPVDDLYAMANEAIDDTPTPADMAGRAQARLAKAPVITGIEELSFDLGPATLTASGQMVAGGAGAMDGTMLVEATGVDALMKKASGDPLLKRAVPVIVFLKGIGEQHDDKLVWNLAYKDGAFTVNGNDMSSMIPGSK